MIRTEPVIIGLKEFVRTYSDKHYIERDGLRYTEAIDPAELERTYTESEEGLPELSAEEALRIILGGDANASI